MTQSPINHMDREEIAKREIGHTDISKSMTWTLVVFFLGLIVIIPLAQQTRDALKGERPQALEIFEAVPDAVSTFLEEKGSFFARIFSANGVLLRAIRSYETELEDSSFLAETFIPSMQQFYADWLGLGNEQAYIGHEGWLYYRPGVDYLIGPPFLEASFLKQRALTGDASVGAAVQPNPLPAILDFHRQLQDRGIHLILMPIPVKGVVDPEFLSRRYKPETRTSVQNPSYEIFCMQLREAGLDVLDVTEVLLENKAKTGQPQFLRTDTHWTPEAMELAATRLAVSIDSILSMDRSASLKLTRTEKVISGDGDVAAMLKLPEDNRLYPLQEVRINPVLQPEGSEWIPDTSAAVLLLGDSFSNIYSLEAMGWGSSAGFAEQLSYRLQQPVDAIRRNDAGAFATREMLAKELAQGKDRLAGKKVVVWEFAMRELAVGDWKLLNLPEVPSTRASPTSSEFFLPPQGRTMQVEARVESRSMVPRPGTVPYKDQIFSVHLTELKGENIPEGAQSVVYFSGMRDNKLTVPSTWKVGQSVRVQLKDWNDVASTYDRLNRSELDDINLQLEPPCWGVQVEP